MNLPTHPGLMVANEFRLDETFAYNYGNVVQWPKVESWLVIMLFTAVNPCCGVSKAYAKLAVFGQ